MALTIIIAFLSLIGLIIIHELGHFLVAKAFGIKVEEFGLGYPPRLFGKKIGETLYSLNLIPFGGFVKIYGQEERINKPRSFSSKPFYQKGLVILAGVLIFWVVAAILLAIVSGIGAPVVVDDSNEGITDPKVQILYIAPDSPAEQAGLEIGNIIKDINGTEVDKASQVQEIIDNNKGQEIILTIQKGQRFIEVPVVPRTSFPEDEGAIGIGLARTGLKSYPWHLAIWQGIKETYLVTIAIVKAFAVIIANLFQGKGLPAGVDVGGPVMIFSLFVNVGGLGASYILRLIAIVAIHLAILNILPIPALDGGWFVFLAIERVIGRPLNDKLVQKVSASFFLLLIALLIFLTIKDIMRFF